jgi:hypothetical protein
MYRKNEERSVILSEKEVKKGYANYTIYQIAIGVLIVLVSMIIIYLTI